MTKCTIKYTLALAATLFMVQSSMALPTAVYDSATGNITFNEFAGVNTVRLFSTAGNLIDGVGNGLGFSLTEKTTTLYSWVDFGGGITGEGLDAGNIVTPGTAVSDLLFDYKIGLAGPVTVGDISGGTVVDPVASSNVTDGSLISLQGAYDDTTGLLAGAIALTNIGEGELQINGVTVSDDASGLFSAAFSGLNVDLGIDVAGGRLLPSGSDVTAKLLVETNGGDFNFDLGATVPEPATFSLVGLALVGLAGMRRRS